MGAFGEALGPARGAVDRAGAGVGERAAGDRKERPVVGGRVQGELEDAERRRRCAPRWSGGRQRAVVRLAAGADGELPDPVDRIGDGGSSERRARLHRRRALVDVVVPDQEEVDTGRVEVVPQRLQRLVGRDARAVARLVPERDHVLAAVGGQVGLEP